MEKYKDYIARTQQDRIALDTLFALEKILVILENPDKPVQYNDEQIVAQEVVEQIKTEVKKTRKKNGGDK
jgi:hypothetical protein